MRHEYSGILAFHTQAWAMSAKIYYLRPFHRENLDGPPVEPEAEAERPSAPRAPGKRLSRNPLPGGKNSKWKRKLGGGAVRRDAGANTKGEPPAE
jgi:hypothetical protein